MNRDFTWSEPVSVKEVVCGVLEGSADETKEIVSEIDETLELLSYFSAAFNEASGEYTFHLAKDAPQKAQSLFCTLESPKEGWDACAARIVILNASHAPRLVIENEICALAKFYVLEQFLKNT